MTADALNRIYGLNVEPVNRVIKASEQNDSGSQSFSDLLEQEQAKQHKVKIKRKENPPVRLIVNISQYNNQAKKIDYLFSSTTDYKA
ncbi:MAG: hypothetical protein J5988_08080 [Eubacterium sp.]|nr:hypothetical protein [Eubacterium sp.]